ncbi:hypothetical protein [Halomonas salina]|uniref:Acyl-CoA dehydrogenase/oxidase C-terminal domain-containing protein n=1 Tax=Halomonas salina TaxID=42565 RepID=A0ABR4WU64_9GAMM|nr:hypothetical protein [Halomonas salina]KGE78261.1 hypothetical protein FP66_04490 [Halomonas salina]
MRTSQLVGGDLSRMSVRQLEEVMRVLGPEEARSHEAARAMVAELMEIEAEWRLGRRHANEGFAPVSPVAGIGEGRGETTGAIDHMAEAATRYCYESELALAAHALVGGLTEHQAAAVLMCTRMVARAAAPRDERRELTSQQLVHPSRQVWTLQRLGFAPGGGCRFLSAGSMRKAATQARGRMVDVVIHRIHRKNTTSCALVTG